MISLAFLGPIPWIYWIAMITRLLVGMLTPAMRATAMLLLPVEKLRPVQFQLLHGKAQTITRHPPRPPGPRHRSNFSLYAGLLMDSTRLRQPLPARALRLATLFFWMALAAFLGDFLEACLAAFLAADLAF